MKELLWGESTISLEAAVLKCPNAELYLYLFVFGIKHPDIDQTAYTDA
jgi:hypothetical protein